MLQCYSINLRSWLHLIAIIFVSSDLRTKMLPFIVQKNYLILSDLVTYSNISNKTVILKKFKYYSQKLILAKVKFLFS